MLLIQKLSNWSFASKKGFGKCLQELTGTLGHQEMMGKPLWFPPAQVEPRIKGPSSGILHALESLRPGTAWISR